MFAVRCRSPRALLCFVLHYRNKLNVWYANRLIQFYILLRSLSAERAERKREREDDVLLELIGLPFFLHENKLNFLGQQKQMKNSTKTEKLIIFSCYFGRSERHKKCGILLLSLNTVWRAKLLFLNRFIENNNDYNSKPTGHRSLPNASNSNWWKLEFHFDSAHYYVLVSSWFNRKMSISECIRRRHFI